MFSIIKSHLSVKKYTN